MLHRSDGWTSPSELTGVTSLEWTNGTWSPQQFFSWIIINSARCCEIPWEKKSPWKSHENMEAIRVRPVRPGPAFFPQIFRVEAWVLQPQVPSAPWVERKHRWHFWIPATRRWRPAGLKIHGNSAVFHGEKLKDCLTFIYSNHGLCCWTSPFVAKSQDPFNCPILPPPFQTPSFVVIVGEWDDCFAYCSTFLARHPIGLLLHVAAICFCEWNDDIYLSLSGKWYVQPWSNFDGSGKMWTGCLFFVLLLFFRICWSFQQIRLLEVPMAEAFKGKSVALYFAGEWRPGPGDGEWLPLSMGHHGKPRGKPEGNQRETIGKMVI